MPEGCVTLGGYGNHLEDTDERILVYLTANSAGARWMALLTIPYIGFTGSPAYQGSEPEPITQFLLRGDDCCLQCAIDQAAVQPGKWYVIL